MSLTSFPKRPTHHKKITGDHHRRSKHYLKTYHPYLPLLLLVIIGLAVNIYWTSHTSVLGAATSLNSSELLTDTNAARLTYNEDNLAISNKLSAAAQAKANDMVTKGYWAHTSPNGQTPWNFIQGSGYDYFTAGENLAYGFHNSSDIISGWMNSPEHRANLLKADYQDVGFGIAASKNYQGHGPATVVVAMYAEPSVGGSAVADGSDRTRTDIPLHNVARVQLLTHGKAPWSLLLVTSLSLLAAGWFLLRHVKAWHRVLVLSEDFVVEHKLLDLVIVSIAVAGFVLTRSAGFIH